LKAEAATITSFRATSVSTCPQRLTTTPTAFLPSKTMRSARVPLRSETFGRFSAGLR
jgi:hypothetical protein